MAVLSLILLMSMGMTMCIFLLLSAMVYANSTTTSPPLNINTTTTKPKTNTTNGVPNANTSAGKYVYAFYWYAGAQNSSRDAVLAKIPIHTTHVMIAFSLWDFQYNNTGDIGKIGIENLGYLGDLKSLIAALSKKGIKTLLSMGGWAYSAEPPYNNYVWKKSTAEAAARVVRDFGFSGIDLDAERDNGGFERESIAMINDLSASLPSGSQIFLTVMGYMAGDGRVNRIVQATKGKLTAVQLMTYGLREDQSLESKRNQYKAVTDKDIIVCQGYSSDGFSASVYQELAKDLKARGPGKAGTFMWGSLDGFIQNIKPIE